MNTIKEIIGWFTSQNNNPSGSSHSWIWLVLIGIVILAVCGYVYYQKWKIGKEKAQLLHNQDVNSEAKQELVEKEHIDNNTKQISDNIAKVEDLKKQQNSIDDKLKQNDNNLKTTEGTINEIKTWDDVDNYLKSKNSTSTDPSSSKPKS